MRWWLGGLALVLVVLAGAAVIARWPNDGVTATWDLDPEGPISSKTTTFTALVTRLECSSGITGKVLEPTIETTESEVVVTFLVENLGQGDASCPGNPFVPYEVTLDEPLGDRVLRDGQCLTDAEAKGTAFCLREGIRWPLATGNSDG